MAESVSECVYQKLCLCIGNRCLTSGYERGSLNVAVPHCSTVRHPEGYVCNKAEAKFGHVQWEIVTFVNSSNKGICTWKDFEKRLACFLLKHTKSEWFFISNINRQHYHFKKSLAVKQSITSINQIFTNSMS